MQQTPQKTTLLPTIPTLLRVAALGAVTVDQLVALERKSLVKEVPLQLVDEAMERIRDLEHRSLVRVLTVQTSHRALRSTERWRYRLTEAGRAHAVSATRELRRVLMAVHGATGDDGWADERQVHQGGKIGKYHLWNIRSILKKYASLGYLERERNRKRHSVTMVTLTEIGRAALNNHARQRGEGDVQVTRPPRLDSAVHHLLVVESALFEARRRRATLGRLWGDEDLRRMTRQGRQSRKGDRGQILPDGRATLKLASGERFDVDIEVLISKYSDVQIEEKYRELPEGTVFYATTKRLCLRVAALVGSRPFLIG